jgi:hypothetical protein
MNRTEIIALARRMATELRNGIILAARFLRSLGVAMADAMAILFPAFV